MPIIMVMEWSGVTRAQYEQVRNELDWVAHKPAGGRLHAAGFTDDGLRVVDIWDSAEAFGRFAEEKLQRATRSAGITTAPKVSMFPAAYLDLLAYREA